MKPSIKTLNETFVLDKNSGNLYWNKKVARKIIVGSEAGSSRPDGYKYVQLNKYVLAVHHVVYAMTHGYWPIEIDHADGNPSNNKPENLRESTRSENNYNRVTPSHNTSGYKGVFKQKKGKSWSVRLTVNKVLHRISGFETKELAKEFLDLMRLELHGQYAHTGVKD